MRISDWSSDVCSSDLAAGDIVLSTVVARAAVPVAEAAAAHLKPDQLYRDLNSAATGTKRRVAESLKASGCGVSDGAMLAPVTKHRHRVPSVRCGPRVAEATAARAGRGGNGEEGGER